jgi:hypothetical protein
MGDLMGAAAEGLHTGYVRNRRAALISVFFGGLQLVWVGALAVWADAPAAWVWPPTSILWLGLSYRRLTARLELNTRGVTIRNMFKTHHISWGCIEGVGVDTVHSLWNFRSPVLAGIVFKVRGRDGVIRSGGTASFSNNTLIDLLAEVQPCGQQFGVFVARAPFEDIPRSTGGPSDAT